MGKKSKRIIGAKEGNDGNIAKVKLSGNSSATPIETAIRMAEKGQIDNVHAVHPKCNTKDYLRTNPDKRKSNNLGEMAKD